MVRAASRSAFSVSSITGSTTYAWRPAGQASRTNSSTRSRCWVGVEPRSGSSPVRAAVPEEAQIEITVAGQGERARNGGGREEQDVGSVALRHQGRPLLHPESMLFVDYHQAEPLEADGLLDEGVGAHDDAHRAGAELPPHLLLFGGREPA